MPLSLSSRLQIVAAVMGLILLVSIPVMSSYGLNVCPVLLPLGFWFGCQYLGLFVLNVVVLNALLLRRITRGLASENAKSAPEILAALPRRGALAYLVAYGVTVLELMAWLYGKDITVPSRGPEILGLLAVLFAILQYYGMAWAVLPASSQSAPAAAAGTPRHYWTRGTLRVVVPAVVAAGVAVHFLLRSASLTQLLGSGMEAPDNALGMIQMLGFLVVWQVAAMAFYAAAEFDLGHQAARHLQAVTNEDYEHRSPVAGSGYWPRLFQAMNELSQGLLERSRLLRGFSSFVSKRVVNDVLRSDLQFGGKREELTVLMADLRDFTTLAETLQPEDVVRLLNLYFYAMIEELGREGVTLDKFIGDGLLAYVDPEGRANPGEECARAARAALGMHRRLEQVNGQLQTLGLPQLRLGVGLTRGALVRGNIGSLERMQYTVIGDSVNLAARLENLCKELGTGIVIDHPVWSLLPPDLQGRFQERGVFNVKGRAEKVRVYAPA